MQIREVSDLRFAEDLAPYAFKELSREGSQGPLQVMRLPADGDPMLERMEQVRERDYSLVDTLNEYYTNFGDNMSEPYTNWRKYSHEELEAESIARRQALTRKVLGAVAVIGGVIAERKSNTSAGSAASTAAVIGGIYAIKSGFDKRAEIKMQGDSLKQLGDSFQAEVQPMVVDVEGRTLQLKGSAEEQYAEWRRLLKELYENETGLPAATSSSAAGANHRGRRGPEFRPGDECSRTGRSLLRGTCCCAGSAQAAAPRCGLRATTTGPRLRAEAPGAGSARERALRARFLDAARLQADLRHPHILACDGAIDADPAIRNEPATASIAPSQASMCGWCRSACRRAASRNRARSAGSRARSGARIFSATSRPPSRSRASQTSPHRPAPSLRSKANRAARICPFSSIRHPDWKIRAAWPPVVRRLWPSSWSPPAARSRSRRGP